jgi:hypothetical protein
MLTYRSAIDADVDRLQQFALLQAIGGQDRALSRDACGAWMLSGKHGHIYSWGDVGRASWFLYVECPTERAWAAAKRKLSFCELRQDGDNEGVFRLAGLPTAARAKVVRTVLGIRKRREYDAVTLQRLRASAGRAFATRRGARIEQAATSLPQAPLEHERKSQLASFGTLGEPPC